MKNVTSIIVMLLLLSCSCYKGYYSIEYFSKDYVPKELFVNWKVREDSIHELNLNTHVESKRFDYYMVNPSKNSFFFAYEYLADSIYADSNGVLMNVKIENKKVRSPDYTKISLIDSSLFKVIEPYSYPISISQQILLFKLNKNRKKHNVFDTTIAPNVLFFYGDTNILVHKIKYEVELYYMLFKTRVPGWTADALYHVYYSKKFHYPVRLDYFKFEDGESIGSQITTKIEKMSVLKFTDFKLDNIPFFDSFGFEFIE
jgi:hypothetical protein